jgi:hypothetical protein
MKWVCSCCNSLQVVSQVENTTGKVVLLLHLFRVWDVALSAVKVVHASLL